MSAGAHISAISLSYQETGFSANLNLIRSGGDYSNVFRVFLAGFYMEKRPALLVGLAFFSEISPPGEIPCKICFRSHERRASPPKRDLTIDYPRSRVGGLEISHINILRRAGPTITHACKIQPF